MPPNPNTDPPEDNNNNSQILDPKKKRTGPKRRKVTHGTTLTRKCLFIALLTA